MMLIRPDPDPQHCTVQYSTVKYSYRTIQVQYILYVCYQAAEVMAVQYSTVQYLHMCVTWQWKWLLFSSLTVQGVWQLFILLESPFWGLQRSMPSIVLQTRVFFNNTEKSGFEVGIYSVRFWIPDLYGIFQGFRSKHYFRVLSLYDYGIFLCFFKIQSNSTKEIVYKKLYKAVLWSQSQEARSRN